MHQDRKFERLSQIAERIRQQVPADEIPLLLAFSDHYYARLSEEDVLAHDPEDLFGAMLSHWRLGVNRQPGQPLVNVFNPDFDVDGWRSHHTIIEIAVADSPFLVDSLSMALTNQGLNIHLIIHPTYDVSRLEQGDIAQISPFTGLPEGEPEAWMHFQVDRISGREERDQLAAVLLSVLSDVRVVVEDWQPMQSRMEAIIEESLANQKFAVDSEEWQEQIAFLEWLNNHHFTYIGYREFTLQDQDGELSLNEVSGSSLGIFKRREFMTRQTIPAQLRQQTFNKDLLVVTKSVTRSTVHRSAKLDYVGVKRYDEQGNVVGEYRFHGLYSSAAYDSRPKSIPILRRKEAAILKLSQSSVLSHANKALEHILHNIPRDILMLAPLPQLTRIANGILSIHDRQRLKVFVVPDQYKRFVQVLVLVPRDHYDTSLRLRIQALLKKVFNGDDVEFTVDFTESIHAQVHFTLRTRQQGDCHYNLEVLEQQIAELTLSWQDRLRDELLETQGESDGIALFNHYVTALPPSYVADFTPRQVVADITRFELLGEQQPLSLHLFEVPESGSLHFRILGTGEILSLSKAMPWLENMGLSVTTASPYEFKVAGVQHWVLNIDIEPVSELAGDLNDVREQFHQAFAKVSSGHMESDGFNALVLRASLGWQEVRLLRAVCKYLLQTKLPFSQSYMEQTLVSNSAISRLLVDYFHARFDPLANQSDDRQQACYEAVVSAIEQVSSLDEDRILRCYLEVIGAVVRTNYYQQATNAEPKEYLSFKMDSGKVPHLPLPRPFYEIFVYAPYVEAIHLRGGEVARGGLRWSDRREDYRTEVLGLMKAQMVKNALIVPVGAKGGFIAKQLPLNGTREAVQDEVQRCYRTFIRGLLDLTDNRIDGEVVPPTQLRRHDSDDPYLVVAADKGTATFSDIANGIAADYGFWLGDAFASGGSHGYDHKKMGITARGAWESVKRHFRERGLDTQQEHFTVAGIGDMSGDVFGNGMLLSDKICLVAAFNHQHIFIDPVPNAAVAFAERERLFRLPRSSWADYNAELISAGGGIYSRNAKSIRVSPQARDALGLERDELPPNELIQAILRAPVDLLWNGGIGTYVKATQQTHADVGDRVNDAVRINAGELRCKVVGEGGNLGFTQLARIEYSRNHGLIYADAIDNSGGVDCSDHEVNIKILLNQLVKDGDMTLKQRNQLLEDMSDEVAQLVLRNNYLQTQLISLTANQSSYFLFDHKQMIQQMEREGLLNRKIEFLPEDDALDELEKSGAGLTRPEISVLLSYGKNRLFRQLMANRVADDSELDFALLEYFPAVLQEKFPTRIRSHSLACEIATTHLTNEVCDRMGSSFVPRMEKESGLRTTEIVYAYLAVSRIFELNAFWDEVAALDNVVSYNTQLELYIESRRLVDRAVRWMLRHLTPPLNIAAVVQRFKPFVSSASESLRDYVPDSVEEPIRENERRWLADGVPPSLAAQAALFEVQVSLLDIALVVESSWKPTDQVAQLYFAMDELLDLEWIAGKLRELPRNDHWKRSMRASLRESVTDTRRDLTAQILQGVDDNQSDIAVMLTEWQGQHQQHFDRYQGFVKEIRAASKVDVSMLLVLTDALKQLARHDMKSR